ncbi:hypothetical protein [uncultured Pseudodesulfovibrio sp.]|uniref:hypothetical protein n=1 Tax=uncultured Pseudodesulfovibrio sp. TaxID=2035858 RepID=UPI0029C8FEF3|nr:hypothetical protein [uncultured Pseudodesulfovibrio sp.]
MFKRTVLIVLLLFLLIGCVEKQTGTTAVVSATLPYSIYLPSAWKAIPDSKVMASGFKEFATLEDGVFGGAYTGAPTADVRIPMMAFTQMNTGKVSVSEFYMVADGLDALVQKMFGEENITISVNEKRFDEKRKRILMDTTVVYEGGMSFDINFAMFFTEKGFLLAFGAASSQDRQAKDVIERAFANLTISPGLQYQ